MSTFDYIHRVIDQGGSSCDRTPPGTLIGVCAVTLTPAGGLHLIPAGEFDAKASQGVGPWRMDRAAALILIISARQRGIEIPIDYEHQTLKAADNGQPAPAAGWIDPAGLIWDEPRGLVAEAVRWTDRARSMIDSGEYRYISPVFTYRKDGTVLELLHAALTNTPALTQLDPVSLQAAATRYYRPEEDINAMTEQQLAALRAALGLPEEADGAAMLAALNQLRVDADLAATDLGHANDEIAALKAGSPDPKKYTPVAALEQVQSELAALRAANTERDVADLIDPALSDGRLLPILEEWARDLGNSDLAALNTYLAAAQPFAALKGNQTGGKAPDAAPDADPVKAAEAKWAATAALRREFPDRGAYVAFARAEAQGRIGMTQTQEAQ